MINILVRLDVKDFDILEKFEQQAVKIMADYQGRVLSAFETIHNADGSGQEIHLLAFPNEEAFSGYRNDSSLAKLTDLRDQAIANTEVEVSLSVKEYI